MSVPTEPLDTLTKSHVLASSGSVSTIALQGSDNTTSPAAR